MHKFDIAVPFPKCYNSNHKLARDSICSENIVGEMCMRSVNLYLLTRDRDSMTYTAFENILSDRQERVRVKECEFHSLQRFVEVLCQKGVSIEELEGFFYSYTIHQIGKEFDLLKVCANKKVLNIELKSQSVSEEKMERQLLKNRYYLKPLAPVLEFYTYVEETNTLYTLKNNQLCPADFGELIQSMQEFTEFERENLDQLLRAKDYLISPLNMPQEFLEDRYFLTQQQETIRRTILEGESQFWGITGIAGTGKTLLLYDLAKKLAARGKICIIHCGMLCEGHICLNRMMPLIDIFSEAEVAEISTTDYRFFLVDEAQRMSVETFELLVQMAEREGKICIFAYDYYQILSKSEKRRNIPKRLEALPDFQEQKLSGRIRSNREMNAFINTLLDLNNKDFHSGYTYKNVDVLYAENEAEAKEIILYYQKKWGYTFIEYDNPIAGCQGDISALETAGLEFESVIITLTSHFRYNEKGILQGNAHPNPDTSYYRLLFQSVSRTREKLCIVVIGAEKLFEKVLSILYPG